MNRSAKSVRGFAAFAFLICASPFLLAIDLGIEETNVDKPQKVEVVNEDPITVTEESSGQVVDIISSVNLKFKEHHRSSALDVRKYREAVFYVVPLENTIFEEGPPPVRYRLDVYFTLDTATTTYYEMGAKTPKTEERDVQEFGNTLMKGKGIEEESFVKLTTGETESRALSCKIYGPYVRAVLTNLTSDDTRKFRVAAYLTK